MGAFDLLNLPNGSIAFVGSVRVDDGGADEFRIELPERNPLFGEWRPKWAQNEHDFDIEILSFGFGSKYNVRNPNQGAKNKLSSSEADIALSLIAQLFADTERRSHFPPFTSKNAHFTGKVNFLPGWIQLIS